MRDRSLLTNQKPTIVPQKDLQHNNSSRARTASGKLHSLSCFLLSLAALCFFAASPALAQVTNGSI